MEDIENFCSNPSAPAFYEFPTNIQDLFGTVSEFCVRNDKGDVDLAHRIVNFYKGSQMTNDQRRGTKAILLCIGLLINLKKEVGRSFKCKIYISSQKREAFTLYYEKELPKQFLVLQNYKKEVRKELVLHRENLREYFIDFVWRHKIIVEKITIFLDEEKPFYVRDFGVTWHNEECESCRRVFKQYGINCMDNDCDYKAAHKKLRQLFLKHHPDKGGNKYTFDKLYTCKKRVINEKCYESIRLSP